jgi:SNF2 family DNA or RNA helicase
MELTEFTFDYVILDEAQAIKNAESQAAKAARLLRGKHRLAMSGTPIENHLGELWSIFEFLNPGMLGAGSVFKRHASGGGGAMADGDRTLLAKALRPFILRRTKAQVVKDLPEKVEQTLVLLLEAAQRKIYEDLRAHYRQALCVRSRAAPPTRIEVARGRCCGLPPGACHPGLIDPARAHRVPRQARHAAAAAGRGRRRGHKVLIFSQFTEFPGHRPRPAE